MNNYYFQRGLFFWPGVLPTGCKVFLPIEGGFYASAHSTHSTPGSATDSHGWQVNGESNDYRYFFVDMQWAEPKCIEVPWENVEAEAMFADIVKMGGGAIAGLKKYKRMEIQEKI